MEQELDSLKKYGAEFQNKCIAAILSDKAFIERIADILSPDYFETSAQKWVVENTLKYFMKFRELPTPIVMATELKTIDDGMKLLKQTVADLLGVVYDHVSESDQQYIKEQFLEFCKTRTLATAIYKSVDLLKHQDYDAIHRTISEAMRAGMERNLGHNYFRDIDLRHENETRDCVKTGWELMDTLMDGGLGRGELGFVVAPAGSGKTWLLCRLGAEAIKQGKNVLHVTLELSENYVGIRYDSCLTGIPFQNVRTHRHIVKAKLLSGGYTAQHWVKYFALKTISAASIKLFIERLQMLENIKIDLLIVDYADIIRPAVPNKDANSYAEAGSVYEELRAIAGELQIPVWSASQSNRGGHELEVLEAHNVADSYRKIMTGDFIISLSRKTEDKNNQCGRIFVMKNRFGADGILFPCRFDSSNGNVYIYDKASAEGKALLEKMKEDNSEKDPHARGRKRYDMFVNGKRQARQDPDDSGSS